MRLTASYVSESIDHDGLALLPTKLRFETRALANWRSNTQNKKNAQANLAFFLTLYIYFPPRLGLTPSIPQSSALSILKTKKRSSELGVFSYFIHLFSTEIGIDSVHPPKLRFENPQNKKTLK